MLTSRQNFLINDSSIFGLQTLDGFVRNCTVQLGYFHSQRCQCLAKKDQKELDMTLNDLFRPCRKGLGMMKCCLNRAISTRVMVAQIHPFKCMNSCHSWANSANSGSCSLCKWVSEPGDDMKMDGCREVSGGPFLSTEVSTTCIWRKQNSLCHLHSSKIEKDQRTSKLYHITKLSSLKNNLILYIGFFHAYDSPFAKHWFVKWPASAYHKEHHIAKPPKGPESGKQESKLWIFSAETKK